MADFCSLADLEAVLGLPAADPAAAEIAIRDVSDAVRGLVGWQIGLEAGIVEMPITYAYSTTVYLASPHVVSIASVVDDGTTLAVDTDYRWRPSGLLTRLGGYWSSKVGGVVVTYTSGYATGSRQMNYLRAIASSAALRRYQNALRSAAAAGASGIQSESTPDYQVSFGVDLGGAYSMLLLPSEREMILRAFGKGVG